MPARSVLLRNAIGSSLVPVDSLEAPKRFTSTYRTFSALALSIIGKTAGDPDSLGSASKPKILVKRDAERRED